jgi:hypothetical protein
MPWLFIGHPGTGWRSAVIYSIIGTSRLVGVNPEDYLTWALTKLAVATTITAHGYLRHDYAALIRKVKLVESPHSSVLAQA